MSQYKQLHRERHEKTSEHARQLVAHLAGQLSRSGRAYRYNRGRTGLTIIDADLVLTTEVATTWDETAGAFLPDGETVTVRLFGPRPDRAQLYGRNTKARPEWRCTFWQFLSRHASRYQGAQARRKAPTIMQAIDERTLAVANAFGSKAKYNCGQAKIELPGGAVVHVHGERDHTVQIDQLNEGQLRAVLSAIAATIEPGEIHATR